MIRQFLDLSTAHITAQTNHLLTALCETDEWPFYGEVPNVNNLHYGYLIHVHCDPANTEWPDDLKAVVALARKSKCDYIMLDRDADQLDNLPVYDW